MVEISKVSQARTLSGTVISSVNDKTIVVSVQRRFKHPLYGKYINRSSKIHAHDGENKCKLGDPVVIQECRPLSKKKSWRLLEVIEK